MIHNSIRIVFFGTPQFSVIVLKKLIAAGMAPVAVVTALDKPAGRGKKLASPPVKEISDQLRIPVLQPQKLTDEQFLQQLCDLKPDVFVIASYGKMLPHALLEIPPHGTINVHPSLLPAYRGPSPIQTAILNGDKETGVTLMLTDAEMDHGPILARQELGISKFTYSQLHDELAKLGGEMLIETLPKWVAGEITPREQDHEKATFTRLLTRENGHIDWSKSAVEIDRMVRALNPWPGTWSFLQYAEVRLTQYQKRVKILEGYPTTEEGTLGLAGTLFKTKNGHLAAVTGNGIFIIVKLQMEGKKPMEGKALFNAESYLPFLE